MIHFVNPQTGSWQCRGNRPGRPEDSRSIRRVERKNCLRAAAIRVANGHVDLEHRHHESWEGDRAGFMLSLDSLGVSYEQSAAIGEVFFHARPSEMDRLTRGRLLMGILKRRRGAA